MSYSYVFKSTVCITSFSCDQKLITLLVGSEILVLKMVQVDRLFPLVVCYSFVDL